jgi:hypothetical protein
LVWVARQDAGAARPTFQDVERSGALVVGGLALSLPVDDVAQGDAVVASWLLLSVDPWWWDEFG